MGQAEETSRAGHHAGVGNLQADEGRWGNGDQTWLYELLLYPVGCSSRNLIQWMAASKITRVQNDDRENSRSQGGRIGNRNRERTQSEERDTKHTIDYRCYIG